MKTKNQKVLSTFLILLTTISIHQAQTFQESEEIHAHSRLHLLPFSKSPIVQSCSKRKAQKAIQEKIKYDYSGEKNAIAFRILEEEGKKTDQVMELSFHFGDEVETWFLKKFEKFFKGLKENENMEIFYGFDQELKPVVKQAIKTIYEPEGRERKVRVYPGEEKELEFFNVNFLIKKN